jgi:hypothetical protein
MTDDKPSAEGALRLRGRLSGDSVEGGGTFLVQADGQRFELVVPAGVELPDLPTGAPVVVSGRPAPEMASFRQQGRMFVVTGIELDGGFSA